MMDLRPAVEVREVPLEMIRRRKGSFDLPAETVSRRSLELLAGGRKDPVIVRECCDGFEIVVGDLEYAVAVSRGESRLEVVVEDLDEVDAMVLRLAEGSRRGDVNPVEEAEMISELVEQFGLSQQEIAVKCGWTQATVANKLRLLKLPAEVLDALGRGIVGERQARALLMVDGDDRRVELLKRAVKMRMSAAEVEDMCRTFAGPAWVERARKSRRKKVFKDMRIFQNGLRKVVSEMRKAGLDVVCSEEVHDEIWEFKVEVRV